jgi:hypothetical protein
MLVFTAVVGGLAVATLHYHPAPPADVPLSPLHSSTAAVLPPPPTIIAPPPPAAKPVAVTPAHPSNPPKKP